MYQNLKQPKILISKIHKDHTYIFTVDTFKHFCYGLSLIPSAFHSHIWSLYFCIKSKNMLRAIQYCIGVNTKKRCLEAVSQIKPFFYRNTRPFIFTFTSSFGVSFSSLIIDPPFCVYWCTFRDFSVCSYIKEKDKGHLRFDEGHGQLILVCCANICFLQNQTM